MRSPLLVATTMTFLLVAQTACGSADPTVDGAAPPTSEVVVTPTQPLEPPRTPPPTTAPTMEDPPTAPPTTENPASPRPTVTEDITIDDGTFDSVAEMGDAASVVVVADVVGITSLGRPFSDRDPNAHEFVAITLATVETLAGESTGEIVLPWQAFATDADGNRTATLVTNGILPPDLGDRLLLFLDPADPAFDEFIGGEATHQLVKLDGIAELDGERAVAGEVGSAAAEQLRTMSLSEIRDAVAS